MTVEAAFGGFEAASNDPFMIAWMIWTWVRLFMSVFYEVISFYHFPSAIS